MRKYSLFYLFVVLGTIILIFRNWFIVPQIIGGDWPYYHKEFLSVFVSIPHLWAPWQGNGLGGMQPVLGLHMFSSFLIVLFVQWLGVPWPLVYKFGWFGLYLLLSCVSISVLLRVVFKKVDSSVYAVACLLYTANTYALMLTGGGQMGVALAYATTPLVFAGFFSLFVDYDEKKVRWRWDEMIRRASLVSLPLAFQLMIDPRITYVTLMGIGIYILFVLLPSFSRLSWVCRVRLSVVIFLPMLFALLINAFWILPMVVLRNNPLQALGAAFTTVGALRFFSFADFSHAISLLHPNWPENIFGKTYFLQPEFLLLPFIAFSSLLFVRRGKNRFVVYFIFLSLLGVFFAKGANDPFGGVYVWLFEHVPGFVVFRDPTKFYGLIAVSYAVLISWSLSCFASNLSKRSLPVIAVPVFWATVFTIFFLFTVRQAVTGRLGGTFQFHEIPQEYEAFRQFIKNDDAYFRTLWVPRQQRFSYATLTNMATEAEPLFSATNSAEFVAALKKKDTPELLSELGIKYLIVPYDSLGELFLNDRKYDQQLRGSWVDALDSISWLKKVQTGPLAIYETPSHKERFWVESGEKVSSTVVNQSQYHVVMTVTHPTTLFFSEHFHSGWIAEGDGRVFHSQKTGYDLNSFFLPTPGTYTLDISFAPQRLVDYGIIISGLTIGGLILVQWTQRKRNLSA